MKSQKNDLKDKEIGKGLKVIGGGFGRTGTTSLKVALGKLGYPCYHMKEVKMSHADLWYKSHSTKERYWDFIFKDFTATVDWPSTAFLYELMEYYPDAKIILTTREAEKWYYSCMQTVYKVTFFKFGLPSKILIKLTGINRFVRMGNSIVWEGTFLNQFANKEKAIEIYNKHVEDVIRIVPKERLLVFSVQEGWAPLCSFLNLPIPDEPFPHANDTEEFTRVFRWIKIFDTVVYALFFIINRRCFILLSSINEI